MSEKRFTTVGGLLVDNENDKGYSMVTSKIAHSIADLLNEQQATITAQKKGLDEYMDNIIALSKENEQLRQQLKTICNTCCYDCEEKWCEK